MKFRPRIMMEERIEARVLLTNRIARKIIEIMNRNIEKRKGREITNRNIRKDTISKKTDMLILKKRIL